MGKIHQVSVGNAGTEPQTFQEALKLSKETGRLVVPGAALCLSISGGKIEAVKGGKNV